MRQLIQWRLKTAIKNAKWYCERGRYVQRFLGGLSAVAGWTDGISCSGGGLSVVQFSAPVSFTNHTGVTFTNTTTGDTGSVSSITTTGSTVIEYTVTWGVADPVKGDVIVFNYDFGTGNYTDADGEAIEDQTLIMFNCLDLVFIEGSIYSGTKDTTTAWLAEKLATGVNMIKIEDMTVGIYIGFTSDPLVEPTTWSSPYVVTTYILHATNDYVAWKGSGTGTFKITQSVAR